MNGLDPSRAPLDDSLHFPLANLKDPAAASKPEPASIIRQDLRNIIIVQSFSAADQSETIIFEPPNAKACKPNP
jgi:hypothetical protein